MRAAVGGGSTRRCVQLLFGLFMAFWCASGLLLTQGIHEIHQFSSCVGGGGGGGKLSDKEHGAVFGVSRVITCSADLGYHMLNEGSVGID